MGQKVHPVGYRLGFTKTWNAKWFAEAKNYRGLLKEDIAIRSTIRGRLRDAASMSRASWAVEAMRASVSTCLPFSSAAKVSARCM